MADPAMILLCLSLLLIGSVIIGKAFVDYVFDWYWPEPVEHPLLAGIHCEMVRK